MPKVCGSASDRKTVLAPQNAKQTTLRADRMHSVVIGWHVFFLSVKENKIKKETKGLPQVSNDYFSQISLEDGTGLNVKSSVLSGTVQWMLH